MMAEFVEIDFGSKYVLRCKKSLSEEEKSNLMQVWRNFVEMPTPTLLLIDGEEFELVKVEE